MDWFNEIKRAVICPVCNGEGKVKNRFTHGTETDTCNGCGGKGWIVI